MIKHEIYRYIILIVFFLTGSGCEKYIAYVNPPEFEQKLVIASFLSPDDTVSNIYVTSNQPVYSFVDHEEKPGDLYGTISNGINETELNQTGMCLWFRHDSMPLIPGEEYKLMVYGNNGLKAEAVTTIPEKLDLSIKVDTVSVLHDELPGYSFTEFRVSTSFSDNPEEKNFYCITGRFTGFKTADNSFVEEYSERLWFEDTYFKDLRANPDNRIEMDTWLSRSYHYYDSAFITVFVMNTEESYYLYHKSIDEFGYTDNPFSEVKPVYTNIKGGLGIFTSYTLDSLQFRLK